MMNQSDRRRQVLLAWAYLQRQQGQVIPANDELAQIALANSIPPGLRTPMVTRWAHVLHHLMWLSDQGHPDPVKDAMRMAPSGPSIAPQPPTPQPPAPQPAPPQPAHQESMRDRFSAQAKHAMDDLSREIESAAAAAREAITQGREPGPHLIRRNTLRQRLARLTRGEDPDGPPAVPSPPPTGDKPEATVTIAKAAEAVPDQRPVEAPTPTPTPESIPVAEPGLDDNGLDPVQKLMMWRDSGGHQDLKDRHLRQIVNSGATNAHEVAASLPASLKSLAGPIAAELGLGGANAPTETERPTRPRPEAVPQPGVAAAPAPAAETGPEVLNPKAISWQQPIELSDEVSRFAEMDFTAPTGEPIAIKPTARPDGTTILRWSAAQSEFPVSIYRIVSDDEHVPYSPEVSEVIGITGETTFTDARAFHSAVRHYQVWLNTGPTKDDALLEQPRLHAAVSVVAKPVSVDIREDEGRVVGRWTVLGQARRVLIYRVPAERGAAGAGNEMYRICHDSNNLTGFVDDFAEPGRRYLYQLMVEAEVGGAAQLSHPTVVPLTTTAVLEPVPDLVCEVHDREGRPRFDLVWTDPPAGQVVIYRTQAAPLAGADAATVDESALPQMKLRSEDRLAHPIDHAHGRSSVNDVPWPRDWHRTYFTPVTVLDGQARVGRTFSAVHVDTPGDPRLVERISEQVLTMQWPSGADTVKVFVSARGGDLEETIRSTPRAEISREKYQRLGGLHFSAPLEGHGCDLHLLPLAFSAGQAVYGKPATVPYPGLLKMYYQLDMRRAPGGQGQAVLGIKIRSDRPNSQSPPFVLVHNPTRLPLDSADGEMIPVWANVSHPTQPMYAFRPPSLTPHWSEPGWVVDVTGRTGWVRVFVDFQMTPGHGTFALLDPPVSQLLLGGL